jgi:hypothetical protein
MGWRGREQNNSLEIVAWQGRTQRIQSKQLAGQRLLFLRSMFHPRITTTARLIIISTPKITRARFTARDYVRASGRFGQQKRVLHRWSGRRIRLTLTRRKSPVPPAPNNSPGDGAFSAPLILSLIRSAKIFTGWECAILHAHFHLPSPHGFLYPRRAGFFRPSARDPQAQKSFDFLAYLQQREHVHLQVEARAAGR